MGYRVRQALLTGLVADAVHPPHGYRSGVAAFAVGWPTGELAPHLLAASTLDTAVHLARGRRDRAGLALAALATAGLVWSIAQARQARGIAEQALRDALGEDALTEHGTHDEPDPGWRDLVNPFRTPRDGVRVERDIAYSDAGRRGLLDVYRPAEREGEPLRGAPVLLQVHGGAWVLGDKDHQGIPLMRHLAARGWVCVALNYRLAGRDPFPAQIVDVKRAIAWIRAHVADYGGDPSYVAITGGSAGGHLATLAALTAGDPAWQPGFEEADTSIQAAVPHYGVYDLAGATGSERAVALRDDFLAPKVLHRRFADDPQAFTDASPLLRIEADAPAFLVVHGASDSLVPVEQARAFVGRLRATSRQPVAYAELPGAQHGFDIFPSLRSTQVVRAVDRFLHWHLAQHRAEHRAGHRAAAPSPGDPA